MRVHVDTTVLLARDHPALGNRDLQFAFYGECCLTNLWCRCQKLAETSSWAPTCMYSHLLMSKATFDAVRTLVIRIQYLPHALIPTLAGNMEAGSSAHWFGNRWTLFICLAPTSWDGLPKQGDTTRKTIEECWMYIYLSYINTCICMYIFKYACTYIYIYFCIYTHIHIRIYMYTYVFVYWHKCKYTCVHICVLFFIYRCMIYLYLKICI